MCVFFWACSALLNENGYKTGILGKYHLGPDYQFLRPYNFTYGLEPPYCWAAV